MYQQLFSWGLTWLSFKSILGFTGNWSVLQTLEDFSVSVHLRLLELLFHKDPGRQQQGRIRIKSLRWFAILCWGRHELLASHIFRKTLLGHCTRKENTAQTIILFYWHYVYFLHRSTNLPPTLFQEARQICNSLLSLLPHCPRQLSPPIYFSHHHSLITGKWRIWHLIDDITTVSSQWAVRGRTECPSHRSKEKETTPA